MRWAEDIVGIELILKIAGIGMVVTVLCQILSKAGRDEQSMLVSIGGMIVALLVIVEQVGVLIRALYEVFGL